MVKKNVLNALNNQIQLELTASYGYLAISVWFESQVLKGFAAFFKKQAEEEREHAEKILEYVQDVGGEVALQAIPAPKQKFASPLEAVKAAREAERKNTESIHAIYALAEKENDLATQKMLDWFIKEQVEEEKWTEELVTLVEKCGDSVGSLFMLDHRVGKVEKE